MAATASTAQITVDGRTKGIARFRNEVAAARGYDRVALCLLGASARLNFPNERTRPATITEIRREQGGRPAEDQSSRYRGVCKLARKNRYAASIKIEKRSWPLGNWVHERDAAIAYDRAARFFLGARARLNFPKLHVDPASPEQIQREQHARAKTKTTSRHLGVSRARAGWHAYVTVDGGRINLGTYDVEEAAAVAHDRAVLYFFGKDAERNFPKRRLRRRRPSRSAPSTAPR